MPTDGEQTTGRDNGGSWGGGNKVDVRAEYVGEVGLGRCTWLEWGWRGANISTGWKASLSSWESGPTEQRWIELAAAEGNNRLGYLAVAQDAGGQMDKPRRTIGEGRGDSGRGKLSAQQRERIAAV